MEPQHLGVVHLVDVVARQDDDVARVFAGDRVEVLVHGVGGAQIPVFAHALLRRKDLDELAELLGHHVPPHPDVAIQRERLVLSGDEDAPQPRVGAIAEREVDDAVRATEVDRRFGPFLGERKQTLSGPAGEENDENVVQIHESDACRGVRPVTPRARRRGGDLSTRHAGRELGRSAISSIFSRSFAV
jgi:hypothetical protein